MNNNIIENDDEESRFLVEYLLSTVEEDKATMNSNEGTVDEVETKSVTDSQVFDWSNLSDAEEEEDISVIATSDVPTYSETVQDDTIAQSVKATFLNELPLGKTFADKDSARVYVQQVSEKCNTPFGTDKSDHKYIKLVCRHYGNYRSARKNEGNKIKTI